MKKAALLCLTLLVTPVFMAEGSHAALTQSERKYCQRKAENYADERAAGNTVGGAIGGAVVEEELPELAAAAGLRQGHIVQRFNCFQGASAAVKVAKDLFVQGVNFYAVK